MTTPQLLWPPPIDDLLAKGSAEGTERVDLLGLIPPNSFDDYSIPNREQKVAGVTLRADRVIMDRERYPDADRSTQHKLSDDIQASCREQGYCISVKEWADKNQHRGTLRLRLRCRASACRFQFQLNWDSKVGFWYISRRRCGTFVHTCKPVTGGDPLTPGQEGNKRKLSDGKGSGSKRARFDPEGPSSSGNNNTDSAAGPSEGNNSSAGDEHGKTAKASHKNTGANENPPQNNNSNALEQALDSARSLLDLSRTASSGGSESNPDNQEPPSPPAAPVVPPAFEYIPVQLGDRVFLQNIANPQLSLLSGPAPAPTVGLSAQQKLAILRGQELAANPPPLTINDLRSNAGLAGLSPGLKAAMQQRCIAYPTQGQTAQPLFQVDPRLLHTGLLMNGGVVNL